MSRHLPMANKFSQYMATAVTTYNTKLLTVNGDYTQAMQCESSNGVAKDTTRSTYCELRMEGGVNGVVHGTTPQLHLIWHNSTTPLEGGVSRVVYGTTLCMAQLHNSIAEIAEFTPFE